MPPRPRSGPSPTRLLLPDAPALVAGYGRGTLLTPDGEILALSAAELHQTLRDGPPPMLVHGPATARRLDLPRFDAAFDLLELFAFCLPAHAAAPTPRGLAVALEMEPPRDDAAAAALLPRMAAAMLRHLSDTRKTPLNRDAAALAAKLDEAAAWPWAPSVLAALGLPNASPSTDALKVWRRLPDWEDQGPPLPPASFPVATGEARARLASILGGAAEQRPQQADYASAAAAAFAPREASGAPHLVLAEAGTGTGKTLGYIAPASLWAERNGAPVWIATYTRNLQRQIDQELGRLYPEPEERRRRVVVRKGRENYLCLLNLEEVLGRASTRTSPCRSAWSRAGRWRRATATCSAATSPAGSPSCTGRRRSTRWPTGAASASAPPAPATSSATSSTPSAAPAPRPWWWRTTRWSWCRRRRAAARTAGRCATCSTRATTCSTPPTPPSPRR
jgi:ATP-dependent DNA helicase DinG